MKLIVFFSLLFSLFGFHTSPESYFQEGEYHFNKQEYKKAIDCYSKAIKVKPEYIDAYFKRGICKMKMDSAASAIIDFDKIIQLRPSGIIYTERGYAKYELKDTIGACEDWSMGCELMDNRSCNLNRNKCR